MKYYIEFCEYINSITNIQTEYIILILSSLLVLVIGFALKKIGNEIIMIFHDENKRYLYYQNYKIVIDVLECILLFFVWDDYIKSIMTLVSVISAAFLLSIRDIISNWVCGLYIKIKKLFKVEDRICIDNIKGDVMNISALEFDLLEIREDEENGQSTGAVISFPNSIVFLKPLKNLTKGFKYIWNEMTIKVELDSDIESTKAEIYKIINNIDEIKKIPKRMKNQINSINAKYRIYYNNYDPIIYTKVVDGHVELKLRYLMNPKKSRSVESMIWNNILLTYKNNTIKLYKEV